MTSPVMPPRPRLCYPNLGLGALDFPPDRKELCPWYKIKEFGDIFNSNQKYPIITQPVFSRSKKKLDSVTSSLTF